MLIFIRFPNLGSACPEEAWFSSLVFNFRGSKHEQTNTGHVSSIWTGPLASPRPDFGPALSSTRINTSSLTTDSPRTVQYGTQI
jgi:hypothetical protein